MANDLLLGKRWDGRDHRIPMSTARRHCIVTGSTGFGKSAFLTSVILQILIEHPEMRVVLIDPKGQTAATIRDSLVPALAAVHPHLGPTRVLNVEPFGPYAVGLNPLLRDSSEDLGVQAYLAARQLDALVEGGLGARMREIAIQLIRVVLLLGGSFATVARLARDPAYRLRCARVMPDADLRAYLETGFDEEPTASVDALNSRLQLLLLLPSFRRSLCANQAVSGQALLETGLTLIDLGGAPQGCAELTAYAGSFLFEKVTSAVFSRSARDGAGAPPVLVIVDEFPTICRASPLEFDRFLAMSRSFGAGLWMACQTLGALDEQPQLRKVLLANVALHVAFNVEGPDAQNLLARWTPRPGVLDPDRPDVPLSETQHRGRAERELRSLPLRTFAVRDDIAGAVTVLRAPSVPFDEAERRSRALPGAVREAYRRGCAGRLPDELAPAEPTLPEETDAASDEGEHPPRRSGRRPPLKDLP